MGKEKRSRTNRSIKLRQYTVVAADDDDLTRKPWFQMLQQQKL